MKFGFYCVVFQNVFVSGNKTGGANDDYNMPTVFVKFLSSFIVNSLHEVFIKILLILNQVIGINSEYQIKKRIQSKLEKKFHENSHCAL